MVFRALAQDVAPLGGLGPADFMDGTVSRSANLPLGWHSSTPDGISLDQAWENRIEGLVDGEIRTAVISKEALIQNTLASGREQGILDVRKLRAAGFKDPDRGLTRLRRASTS